MVRSTLCLAIAVIVTAPVSAQNLLVNPGFDLPDQLTGWTCTTASGVTSWSMEDRMGSPTSGSMQHDVSADVDDRSVRCTQCVPIDENDGYIASAWYYWPNDSGVFQSGSTRITLTFYNDVGCSVNAGGGVGRNGYPVLDTWVHLSSPEAIAPAGSVAAGVFFFTWQDTANEFVRARLDDLDFSTTTIFRDGFESGTMSAWSDSEPPIVVINEIMQNPFVVADTSGEWFEIFNPGASDVDINGWTISDAGLDTHVINNGGPLVVGVGDLIVLGIEGNPSLNGGVTVDYVYSEISLANSSDELILSNDTGALVDLVAWDDGLTFPDPSGGSMALADPALDNSLGENWCISVSTFGAGDLGTPGFPNDQCP